MLHRETGPQPEDHDPRETLRKVSQKEDWWGGQPIRTVGTVSASHAALCAFCPFFFPPTHPPIHHPSIHLSFHSSVHPSVHPPT